MSRTEQERVNARASHKSAFFSGLITFLGMLQLLYTSNADFQMKNIAEAALMTLITVPIVQYIKDLQAINLRGIMARISKDEYVPPMPNRAAPEIKRP